MQQFKVMTNGVTYNVYASCDDIPEYGCIYPDGFGAFNEGFDATACESYGGIPCEGNTPEVYGVRTKMPQISMKMQMWMMVLMWYCTAPADWNVIVTGSNHTIVFLLRQLFHLPMAMYLIMQMLVYSTQIMMAT